MAKPKIDLTPDLFNFGSVQVSKTTKSVFNVEDNAQGGKTMKLNKKGDIASALSVLLQRDMTGRKNSSELAAMIKQVQRNSFRKFRGAVAMADDSWGILRSKSGFDAQGMETMEVKIVRLPGGFTEERIEQVARAFKCSHEEAREKLRAAEDDARVQYETLEAAVEGEEPETPEPKQVPDATPAPAPATPEAPLSPEAQAAKDQAEFEALEAEEKAKAAQAEMANTDKATLKE
jgi:hypothetical protein